MEDSNKYKAHTDIYNDLKRRGHILFETVIGSQAHGTATPNSDVDTSFVYMAPKEWLYVRHDYQPHLKLSKDCVGYELENFLELVATNNPTVLELQHSPEDCWLILHSIYQRLLDSKDLFLSKLAQKAYLGYAKAQIIKAKGMEKFQNWSAERKTRKEPYDFCWIIDTKSGYDTMPLRAFLERENLSVKNIGVANVNNAPNTFSLFKGDDYRGIFGENSDQILFTSIPKGEKSIALLVYNQNAYKMHTADWKRYVDWEKNANRDRWVETKSGEKIDGKNIMHYVRLMQMNRELASGQGVNVRRPNRDELLLIRSGGRELTEITEWAEKEEKEVIELYTNSSLPNTIDMNWVRNILFEMRVEFYAQTVDVNIGNMKLFDNKFLTHEPAR